MAEMLTLPIIGPGSHGTRMALDEFAHAAGQPGYLYELEQGVIVVVDVPGVPHAFIKQVLRNALTLYQASHPQRIALIAGGDDSALRLPDLQSERHPDLSVYVTSPPTDEAQPWDYWVPDIAVEIVSASSARRDYRTKRGEYLKAGIRVYWIIDPRDETVTALTRRGDQWRPQKLTTKGVLKTGLLPGFKLKVADLFAPISRVTARPNRCERRK